MKYENCFLGIGLPEEYLDVYTDLQERIKEIDPSLILQDINILEPHITIYYCGEQTEEILNEISKIAKDSKNVLKGLTLKVGGLDFFPKEGYNVLFLDVVYPKELVMFQEKVSSQLAKFNQDKDALKFHPHMTIGGMDTNRSPEQLERVKIKLKEEFSKVNLEFPIKDLVIYGIDPSNSNHIQKHLYEIIV
jgi:2'-5' RNA ligase